MGKGEPTAQDVYDDESVIMRTEDGQFDLRNLPGRIRRRLIITGQVKAEQFATPANMPGAKLKALREEQKARSDEEGIIEGSELTNPYKVGDIISWKNKVYEVLEVNENKVKFEKEPGKNVWVPYAKVEKG